MSSLSSERRVVAIGGGGGVTQVLRALQDDAFVRTAVIAVTDTGRSTGLARVIGGMPAPGDLRATIAAFARDPLLAQLVQYRLTGAGVPQLEGMAFGNLLIAALAQMTGDFSAAVEQVAQLVGCAVQVLPVSPANTQLCAELADGTLVEGELAVRGLAKPPIARLFLRDPALAAPAVVEAIRAADMVILGPGSLFTTLLAVLLFEGVVQALQETRGFVVYICNTTTQPGQTDGYAVSDHVQRVVEVLGPGVLDVVLMNNGYPDQDTLAHYAADGVLLLRPTAPDIAAMTALGVRPFVHDLIEHAGERRTLWKKQDTVRHDIAALRSALHEIEAWNRSERQS